MNNNPPPNDSEEQYNLLSAFLKEVDGLLSKEAYSSLKTLPIAVLCPITAVSYVMLNRPNERPSFSALAHLMQNAQYLTRDLARDFQLHLKEHDDYAGRLAATITERTKLLERLNTKLSGWSTSEDGADDNPDVVASTG